MVTLIRCKNCLFFLGQKRSAWMRELCTVLTISSSFLQGKEITTRDLDVSNIKSVGKVTNQMGNNRQFRSPPLDVVCFIFCHYVIFLCIIVWSILPIHLPILYRHICYHCGERKKNQQHASSKVCIFWKMEYQLLILDDWENKGRLPSRRQKVVDVGLGCFTREGSVLATIRMLAIVFIYTTCKDRMLFSIYCQFYEKCFTILGQLSTHVCVLVVCSDNTTTFENSSVEH